MFYIFVIYEFIKSKLKIEPLLPQKLLAAGEEGDVIDLDAPAYKPTTTRRPRVVPTNPPQPPPAAFGGGGLAGGSGSGIFQLLRAIGGASLGPSNYAAPAAPEPEEVYLEPATTQVRFNIFNYIMQSL
jgi:hypothetical protein